jgi:hypothetical protein
MVKLITILLLLTCQILTGQDVLMSGTNRIVVNGSPATVITSPSPTPPPSFTNTKYLSLNGSDEYAYFGSAMDFGNTATVSFWFDPRTRLLTEAMIGRNSASLAIATNAAGTNTIRIANQSLSIASLFGSDNTWYHYVMIKNGVTVDVYVNGAYKNTLTYTADNDFSLNYIGYSPSATNFYFGGYIDEVAAWDDAPAAYTGAVPAEVTSLYGSGTPATCGNAGTVMASDLQIFWRFEGSANDETGTYNLTTQGIDGSNYVSY